ncbi:MAG: OmpH family outer membrane protein [Verrucomicrobiales bacterium]
MKKLLLATLASLAFSLSAQAQKGGVAVLDIDAVARNLGVEEQVRQSLVTMQNSLNEELQKKQQNLQSQMAGVEQAAGEDPSEEKRREIMATNQQLNAEFNRLKAQAQEALVQERVRLINEFRIDLEPIALKAAEARDLDVVLMKVTPPVFAYGADVDITEDTTALAIEAGMNVEPSTTPTSPATPTEDANGNDDGGDAESNE